MTNHDPNERELLMFADLDGVKLIDPVTFTTSHEEVFVVDERDIDRPATMVIRFNGLIVIPATYLNDKTEKAYKEQIPKALRHFGLLPDDEGAGEDD